MDTLKWQLVEVPSMGPMYRAVVNEEGYTVCPPIMRTTAEQIIAEHNAHASLVRVAELVQHAAQNRADRDWTQMHLDLSEAAELAKQVAPLAAPGAPQ